MRLFSIALVSFGLTFVACDKKETAPEAAAPTEGAVPVVEGAVAADPAGNAEKPAEPAVVAEVAVVAEPAAEPVAAVEPVAALAEVGIASCDKYIKAAQGCLDKAPAESRAAQQQAFATVVDAWRTQLTAQGDAVKPALDTGCTQAYETAKTAWASMCPDFAWE